jgi:hypothetical protein
MTDFHYVTLKTKLIVDCSADGKSDMSTFSTAAMGQSLHQIIVYYDAHWCMQYANISNGTAVLQCFHHTQQRWPGKLIDAVCSHALPAEAPA